MSSAKPEQVRLIVLAQRGLRCLGLIGRLPVHRGKLKVSREVCTAI